MKAWQALVALALAMGLVATTQASAQDKLKIAITQRGAWDTGLTEMGQKAGLFKKHGLDVEILYTQAGPEAIQALIAGSVDIATGTGVAAAIGTMTTGRCTRSGCAGKPKRLSSSIPFTVTRTRLSVSSAPSYS